MRRKRPHFFLLRPLPVGKRGFSLVEVVLALGIVAFSLVGVLSIFPVALDTAKDSKNETRITLIAQSIFSDLISSPITAAEVVVDEVTTPGTSNIDNLSLTSPSSVYVAYNAEGQAFHDPKLASTADFNSYKGSATFVASITSSVTGVQDGLAQVDVLIQAPPQAGSTAFAQKKYYFSAYLPNR